MIRLTHLAFTEWPTAWSVVHLLLWVGSGMTGLVFIGRRIVLKENLLWDSQRLVSGASPERRIVSAIFPGTQGPNAPRYNLSISNVCPNCGTDVPACEASGGKVLFAQCFSHVCSPPSSPQGWLGHVTGLVQLKQPVTAGYCRAGFSDFIFYFF